MDNQLTNRQRKIYEFIKKYYKERGFSPTLREIAQKMGIRWVHAVEKHLSALEKKGYVYRVGNLRKEIRLTENVQFTETPIIGRIAAGQPILAQENMEGSLMLGSSFSSLEKSFLLKVKGMSMRDAGIMDGDLVLVRQQPSAEQGEMVAAMINDEATVKYFKRTKSGITLEPANPEFKPISIRSDDQFSIIGKVVVGFRIFDQNYIRVK